VSFEKAFYSVVVGKRFLWQKGFVGKTTHGSMQHHGTTNPCDHTTLKWEGA
jgi:hypothetical protein